MEDETLLSSDSENNTLMNEIKEETPTDPPAPEPEEEEADEPNLILIFSIVFFIILIFIIGFMIFGPKKKSKNDELDKSGSKTAVSFDYEPVEKEVDDDSPANIFNDDKDTAKADESSKSDDEILKELPPELQLGEPKKTKGVSPVVATSQSNTVEKPDTRNSRSMRTVEGLSENTFLNRPANNSYAETGTARQNMYDNFSEVPGSAGMTKNDYVNGQLEMMQKLRGQVNTSYGQLPQSQFYQGNKEQFFNESQTVAGRGQWLSDYSLWDGTIISGALVTAINTDNPGVVIARCTENVYSSYDHRYLLIPEGSLLYATYNSNVSFGQNKVQVIWNLLIRPDGYRIELGNMNGVNAQGASGYKGSVSNHPFETLKALGLVAVFSVIQTEITGNINTQDNDYLKNAMGDVYSEASKLGNKILDKALDIKPTIKIKEGTEIKLITNTPLELPPVENPEVTHKYVRTR